MNLSDYIRALHHILREHGDLRVLEERVVWYDGITEFFPDDIQTDKRVIVVAAYHGSDGKHHFDRPNNVAAEAKDRREFKAFVV